VPLRRALLQPHTIILMRMAIHLHVAATIRIRLAIEILPIQYAEVEGDGCVKS
jgi:hypothetical protein